MMASSLIIARDVLIDARRNAIFAITFLISLGLIFLCSVISFVDNNFGGKIYLELGVSLLWFIHFALAVVYTAECLYNEDERKSIYFYLSRNLSRQQYLLGKFLGLQISILLSLFLSGTIFLICTTYLVGFKPQILYGILFIFLEVSVVISAMILLSRVVTKFLSYFVFIFLFFFTNFLDFLQVGDHLGSTIKTLFLILPNFKYYDFIQMLVHAKQISLEYVFFLCVYTIFICLVLNTLSILQYEHKSI